MAGGPCTGLQSRPPVFLDIPSVTVDALPRLVPSFEAALQVHMGSAHPPEFPGAPHALAPDNLIGINSIEVFEDTWHWTDDAQSAFDDVMRCGNTDAAEMLRAMRAFLKENDLMAYLTMLVLVPGALGQRPKMDV